MSKNGNDPFSILLVVDDVKRRNNLSSRLRSRDCSVEASTGGFHTMSLLEEKPEYYEMVIIIGKMPDMSAYEQASLIRTTYDHDLLKVVYLYPKVEFPNAQSVLDAGADDVIEDNDRFDILINAIENHRQ